MTEFALALRDGTLTTGDLADLLAACAAGDLADLPGMRPEWRPGVVAHLAALACVLPRYVSAALVAAGDWRGDLDRLLPGALPGQWAFHPNGITARVCLADTGPGFLSQGHEAKPAWTCSPATWALAAMGGLHRPFGGRGDLASPWQGGCYALTGNGTLASEVRVLAEAWSRTFVAGADAAAHFPGWLVPVERVAPLPVPCLWHQRPVRAQPDGTALRMTGHPRVVTEGLLPSMPHAVWRSGLEGTRPFALALAAPVGKIRGWIWGPRTHLTLLAGKEVRARSKRGEAAGKTYTIKRPATLDDAGPVLRLYGFGTAQGKAEACYLTLSGDSVTGLRRRPLAKAAADTVTAWLEAVEDVIVDTQLVETHGGLDAAARVVDLCAIPRNGWVGVLRPWAQQVFEKALAARLASLHGLRRAQVRLKCEEHWARAVTRLAAEG